MNNKNILLLPALVERAKDAARAVKQGVHVSITEVSDAALTELLGLEQFDITGYGIEQDKQQDIVHIYCKNNIDASLCPGCHAVSTSMKEYKDRCVRDSEVWGKS